MPKQKVHWVGGAGLHGYLYNDGPHVFATKDDAVRYFAEAYSDFPVATALRRNHHIDLRPIAVKVACMDAQGRRGTTLTGEVLDPGNEYIEIDNVSCEGPDCPYCKELEDG